MKAAVVPAVSSSWQIKDVPQPQPGPNQVLVKMHASGICYTDVHLTLGHFPGPFPRILGHEPVGEIVAVAPDVTTRKVGDRVGTAWIQSTCGRCEWCQRGRRMFCPYMKGTGIEAQGGHAEYMLMNADVTYLIPDKVSYEQAAPIFCAGYTVYGGLRWADPQPHERVAVLGIGGLGHLAVQYAKAAGFHTIAVSHSPDKDKLIRDLGADEIVRDGKSLAAAGGADVILSTSNSTKSMVDGLPRQDDRHRERDDEPVQPGLHDHQAVDEADRGADREQRDDADEWAELGAEAEIGDGRISHAPTIGARPKVDSSDRSIPPISRIRLSPTTTTPSAEICCPTPVRLDVVRNAGLTSEPTTTSTTSTGSRAGPRDETDRGPAATSPFEWRGAPGGWCEVGSRTSSS